MQYKTRYIPTTVTHVNNTYADDMTMKMQCNLPSFAIPTAFMWSVGLTTIKTPPK